MDEAWASERGECCIPVIPAHQSGLSLFWEIIFFVKNLKHLKYSQANYVFVR